MLIVFYCAKVSFIKQYHGMSMSNNCVIGHVGHTFQCRWINLLQKKKVKIRYSEESLCAYIFTLMLKGMLNKQHNLKFSKLK